MLFCDFIRRWPTLAQVKRARRATPEQFFHEHNLYRRSVIDRRIGAIKQAEPLTSDEAVIGPYRLQVLTLADQVALLLSALRRYGRDRRGRPNAS